MRGSIQQAAHFFIGRYVCMADSRIRQLACECLEQTKALKNEMDEVLDAARLANGVVTDEIYEKALNVVEKLKASEADISEKLKLMAECLE